MLELLVVVHSRIYCYVYGYSWIDGVPPLPIGDGGVEGWIHDEDNTSTMLPFL